MTDSIAADSLVLDSIAADSISTVDSLSYGVVLTPPEHIEARPKPGESTGMSIILATVIILFAIIGLRFRNNRKYVISLRRNLVETRLRQNVFDETVRETTFLVLLNLLWSFSAGILLFTFLRLHSFTIFTYHFSLPFPPSLQIHPAISMGICIAVMNAYSGFMAIAYTVVGSVFSDLRRAKIWLKGFSASQGLLSFLWFPLALISIFYPEWSAVILLIALSSFILAKIVFIWKGFRIFFTQFSSWVLFLYYLCSLEIVPLILTCLGALFLCGLIP
ncbi:MAG: DUF4271 domain-containing protein [Muribaculaceae bacterium]|nr:DUF4271 domain-containing protein [Muribaculaceae bacterium]